MDQQQGWRLSRHVQQRGLRHTRCTQLPRQTTRVLWATHHARRLAAPAAAYVNTGMAHAPTWHAIRLAQQLPVHCHQLWGGGVQRVNRLGILLTGEKGQRGAEWRQAQRPFAA